MTDDLRFRQRQSNGHGEDATPDDEARHARFPHFNPLPKGEEANERFASFTLMQRRSMSYAKATSYVS